MPINLKKKPEKKTLQMMTLVGDVCQIWLVSRWQIVYANRCDLPTLVSEWIFDSVAFNLNSRYIDVGMDHKVHRNKVPVSILKWTHKTQIYINYWITMI